MSKDLISSSKLRNDFDEKCYGECCYCTERDNESGECGLVQYAPTVDAVEVVRCRDCLNAMKMPESVREYFGYQEDVLDCGVGGGVMLPDDYCSKGCKMDAKVE